MKQKPKAFTLVELLVVIGIIALLISILLPVMGRVREAAKKVACQSNMRSIGQALLMNANDHRGYMPLVGKLWLGTTAVPVKGTPANLSDPSSLKYSYYTDDAATGSNAGVRPMPMAAALSPYLRKGGVRSNTKGNMLADISSGVLRNIFTCPSDLNNVYSVLQGASILQSGPTGGYFFQVLTWDSYCYNAEFFGWDDKLGPGGSQDHSRARGRVSAIRHSTDLMLMSDGLPSAYPITGYYEIYAHYTYNTLGDAYGGTVPGAGNRASFDLIRHRKRINVLFADGHVGDFSLDAKSLADIYLAKDFQ